MLAPSAGLIEPRQTNTQGEKQNLMPWLSQEIGQAVFAAFIVIAVFIAYLWRFASRERALALALAICLLDQAVKAVVVYSSRQNPSYWFDHPFLGGWLHLTYEQNRGLGFDSSFTPLLLPAILFAITLLLLYRRLASAGYRMSKPTQWGCALLIGGLLGIALDRVRLGYVVDFLGFGKPDYRSYNLADLAVLAAFPLLAVDMVKALARASRRGISNNELASVVAPVGEQIHRPVARRKAHWLWTPLILLAAAGSLHFIWTVLFNEERGMPPLHRAALHGRATMVSRYLAQGANVNARDSVGQTPLYYAAEFGHTEAARVLISKGADVNARVGKGTTVDMAIAWRATPEIINLLLDKGAKLSDLSLHAAMHRRAEPQLVQMLIDRGAKVNTRDAHGDTPLILAARYGNRAKACQPLLKAGAEVKARDSEGKTALHFAAGQSDAELIKMLLSAGADPNARDNEGRTPLHSLGGLAVSLGGPKSIDAGAALLAGGADVNARAANGETPLIHAVLKGEADWVKRLLAAGANVNARGPKGWTALHYAAAKGKAEIITALLAAGTRPATQNDAGKTPLQLAKDAHIADLLQHRSQ